MADKKISQLTAATLPLAGTEVLPIVQSNTTVKVANNDLRPKQIQSNATSGVLQITGPAAASTRVMTTPNADFTAARTDAAQSFSGNQNLLDGNLVIGTSGKGIDFSATANSDGTMTSELLADYEEGTYTLRFYDAATGGNASSTTATVYYTKIGRQVTVTCGSTAAINTTGMTAGAVLYISLPYAPEASIGLSSSAGIVAFEKVTYPSSTVTSYVSIGTGARANFFGVGSGLYSDEIRVSNLTSGTSKITRLSFTYFTA